MNISMLENAPPGCPDLAAITKVRAETLARLAADSSDEICSGERWSAVNLASK